MSNKCNPRIKPYNTDPVQKGIEPRVCLQTQINNRLGGLGYWTPLSHLEISSWSHLKRPHPHPCRWIWWQLPLLPQLPSIFQRDPTPTLAGESDGNYPYYPNYRLFFRETPPPLLKLNLNGNYPYYPNYRLFFRETPPHPWSRIWR